jgi:hypothetical protein
VVQENWVPLTFTPLPAEALPNTKAVKDEPVPKKDGATIQQQIPASTNAQPHVVRTILLEVHHEVRFNAVGGFYWSTLRQRSFSINPGPVYCTTGPGSSATTVPSTTGSCGAAVPSYPVGSAIQTQNTHQLGFMLGFEIYFVKRDLFPGSLTKTMRAAPGLLLGAAPGSAPGFMFGLNWEPMNGVDFYTGAHYAQVVGLANGINSSTLLPTSGTVPTVTPYRCCGLFLGAGIDLHVFQSIFSGLLGGGGPGAASSGSGGGTTGGGKGGKGN